MATDSDRAYEIGARDFQHSTTLRRPTGMASARYSASIANLTRPEHVFAKQLNHRVEVHSPLYNYYAKIADEFVIYLVFCPSQVCLVMPVSYSNPTHNLLDRATAADMCVKLGAGQA